MTVRKNIYSISSSIISFIGLLAFLYLFVSLAASLNFTLIVTLGLCPIGILLGGLAVKNHQKFGLFGLISNIIMTLSFPLFFIIFGFLWNGDFSFLEW